MEKSFKDFLDEKLKQAKPIIIEKCGYEELGVVLA